MGAMKKFEQRFEEEIIDLLILTKESVSGAACEKNMLIPSVEFFASVNLSTNEFSPKKGILKWMIKDSPDRIGWGFDFQQSEIYHIKARKEISNEENSLPVSLSYLDNCYMVVEIVEAFVSDSRLDKLKEQVIKPVMIEEENLGRFVLNRQLSLFEGTAEWHGKKFGVILEPDDESEDTAEKAFSCFKEFYKDIENWDFRCRTYAAKELLEQANEWLKECAGDGEKVIPITQQSFVDRICLTEISISPDGDFMLFYNDDDLFFGHLINIEADIDGELFSAYISG